MVTAELRALGVHTGRADRGGVTFRATHRQLYAANAWLRCATRVLVRIGSFTARSFPELQRRTDELDWDGLVRAGAPLRLRVTTTASQLYHSDAVAERVAAVLHAPLVSGAEDPDFEAPLLVVRVNRDKVTISADSSGLPLYRRGWHRAAGPAPLRETLAAALLAAVGWDGTTALLDPMCGAGTIPIEAARLAAGLPPSLDRSYTFQRWPGFEPGSWASVSAGLAQAVADPRAVTVPIVGADRDARAVEASRANAAAAGVDGIVELHQAPLSSLTTPEAPTGWLLTNPPYGKRVAGAGDLRNLYATLGNVARDRLDGWHVGLLCADRALAGHTGLALSERFATTNGGIDVTLLTTA